jgi:hypothetical protein
MFFGGDGWQQIFARRCAPRNHLPAQSRDIFVRPAAQIGLLDERIDGELREGREFKHPPANNPSIQLVRPVHAQW